MLALHASRMVHPSGERRRRAAGPEQRRQGQDQGAGALYFAKIESLSGVKRSNLTADQRIWLKWRDTCPLEGDCIQRRYEQRIVDLAGPDRALPILGRAYRALAQDALESGIQLAEVRLGDGRYEKVLPDGTIEWMAFDGGASGVERPDGSGSCGGLRSSGLGREIIAIFGSDYLRPYFRAGSQ